ncbi:MAG: hypothetical protein IPK26_10925 [Planctomycetes bacterium]|nr:hypothetical protein [Planctomycetota bacterium]
MLQEIIGYLLIPDTSLQKLFFIKGPRRCGKGTILRVVADLVGKANVTGLSLNRVNQGTAPLEPLLGKLVWLVSDLRLENRAMAGAVERLLNITGEDVVTVERKYKPAWEGILPARVFMAANKVPRLSDPSGALAGRFVPLEIEASFFGREDRGLQDALRKELPGILNWALDGWARLRARGRFELPPKSQALVDAIYRTGSHVVAFLEDCCEEDPQGKVGKDALFDAYRRWCKPNDVQHTLTKAELGSEVAAALHGVVRNGQRLSVQEGRESAWGGIALKHEWTGTRAAGDDGPF